MSSRHDWDALKLEFLQGPYIRVADFLRAKNIRDSGNTRNVTKGWADERKSIKSEIERETTHAIKQKIVESHVSIVERHKKIWKAIEINALALVEQARKDKRPLDPTALKKIAETLKIATEGERLANGMSTARTEQVQEQRVSIDALVQKRMKERGLAIDGEVVEPLQIEEPHEAPITPTPDAGAGVDA
jgi:hypothetical protein